MTESGYCSDCGHDVELTPEGGCPAGHGTECISDPRALSDIGKADSPEAIAPPSADEAAPHTPPEELDHPLAPQRDRTGLIVVLIAAAVILLACVGTGLLLLPVLQKSGSGASQTQTQTQASPDRAKVQTAIGFLQALFAEDALAIKPYLVDTAQNAITMQQWKTLASAVPTVPVKFDAPSWSGAATATVTFSVQEATGTVALGPDPTSGSKVAIVLATGGETNTAVVALAKVGSGWRVLSITGAAGDTTTYDAAFVKQMVQDTSSN
jgi:hypothetical protein